MNLGYRSKLTKEIVEQNLPLEIKVRFVQVILDDGEVEVLATSVLDEVLITEDFKELYFKRWGIETFYEIIKNRLSLENFTGLSPLAIKQDFYATIFISNLETIVIQSSSEELDKKTNTKFKQKINKSVSFNTVKNYCFELFYSNKDIEVIFEEMSKMFLTNTVQVRPNRKYKITFKIVKPVTELLNRYYLVSDGPRKPIRINFNAPFNNILRL